MQHIFLSLAVAVASSQPPQSPPLPPSPLSASPPPSPAPPWGHGSNAMSPAMRTALICVAVICGCCACSYLCVRIESARQWDAQFSARLRDEHTQNGQRAEAEDAGEHRRAHASSWWNDDWSPRHHAGGAGGAGGPCCAAPLIAPTEPDGATVGGLQQMQVEASDAAPPRVPLSTRIRGWFEPLRLTSARVMEQALAFSEPPIHPG